MEDASSWSGGASGTSSPGSADSGSRPGSRRSTRSRRSARGSTSATGWLDPPRPRPVTPHHTEIPGSTRERARRRRAFEHRQAMQARGPESVRAPYRSHEHGTGCPACQGANHYATSCTRGLCGVCCRIDPRGPCGQGTHVPVTGDASSPPSPRQGGLGTGRPQKGRGKGRTPRHTWQLAGTEAAWQQSWPWTEAPWGNTPWW